MYEKRLCAFVDILGFRDLVQRSLNNTALQAQIHELLREVSHARPVWDRDSPVNEIEARLRQQGIANPKLEAERRVNEYEVIERGCSFSDSIVLSSTVNDHAITYLVTSLLFLSRGLAELGKYARGGVSLGLLCHEKDICFGPALINAYDLEKKAEYPRIVFSAEALTVVEKVNLQSVGPLASYLREDVDGQRFLDFLNQAALDLVGPFRSDQMREIRYKLGRQISSSKTPDKGKEKLVWLTRYFNLILKESPIAGIDPLYNGK